MLVPILIGLRYLRTKRQSRFISLISLISMLGIALGVTVLITVLSVMNGFDEQIKQRLFGMANHITVYPMKDFDAWKPLRTTLLKQPNVAGAAPFIAGQGLLNHGPRVHSVALLGILPHLEKTVSVLSEKMIQGQLTQLKPNQFGLIIGEQLAERLALSLGQEVTVITPKPSNNEITPIFKHFTVVGLFKTGHGFGFDSQYAFMHLQDARRLYHMKQSTITAIRLKTNDLYQAMPIADQLQQQLGPRYQITDWSQIYGHLFHALRLQKTMMFLILFLIIAVAAFNLVSSLVMVVTDKQSDIAILRTLGMTTREVMIIFITQGFSIGCLGTAIGTATGILLALHATQVVTWLETLLQTQLVSKSAFFVDFLPSQLDWHDVYQITALSLLLTLLATLYPAKKAASYPPAEALRYE